jgi:hypothetical protein
MTAGLQRKILTLESHAETRKPPAPSREILKGVSAMGVTPNMYSNEVLDSQSQ